MTKVTGLLLKGRKAEIKEVLQVHFGNSTGHHAYIRHSTEYLKFGVVSFNIRGVYYEIYEDEQQFYIDAYRDLNSGGKLTKYKRTWANRVKARLLRLLKG